MVSVLSCLEKERKAAKDLTDAELRAEIHAVWDAVFDALHLGWKDQAIFLAGAAQALSYEGVNRVMPERVMPERGLPEGVPGGLSPVGLRARTEKPEVESTAWNAKARARREGRWGQVGVVTALTGEREDTFVLCFDDGHKAPYEKRELQFDWLDLAL